MAALTVALALAVRKPKPAVPLRATSISTPRPNDTYDPSQPQSRFKLHQRNWETA
jgi:hypothetical protein